MYPDGTEKYVNDLTSVTSASSTRMTDEEMEAELQQDFDELNKKIATFMRKRPPASFESDNCYIEHYSIERIIYDYIRCFNENVRDYGNGFETDWDDDAIMHILYKNGTVRCVSVGYDDGTKRIKTDGIEAVIYDSGWGTAYAGKCVIYNMRETVDYGKWGYKDIEQRYNDFDDIRVGFARDFEE